MDTDYEMVGTESDANSPAGWTAERPEIRTILLVDIVHDILHGHVTRTTKEKALRIEREYPDEWNKYQWVRIIGGSSKWGRKSPGTIGMCLEDINKLL